MEGGMQTKINIRQLDSDKSLTFVAHVREVQLIFYENFFL